MKSASMMRKTFKTLVALFAVVLAASVSPAMAMPPPLKPTGAEGYCQWLMSSIDTIQKQLPQITKSAELAAKMYVEKEVSPAFAGDPMFGFEAYGRSGGLKGIDWPDVLGKPEYKGVILYAFREGDAGVKQGLDEVKAYKARGCTIVGVGRAGILKAAKEAKVEMDFFIETGAAEKGGLVMGGPDTATPLLPTEMPASMVALWTWSAEFIGACTRLGRMPTMWQSIAMEGAAERNKKIEGKRWHDEKVEPASKTNPKPWMEPLAAGVLGQAYIDALKADLKMIHDKEMGNIAKAAKAASAALAAGHKAYAMVGGHAVTHAFESPYDAKQLTNITTGWNTANTDILKKGDFVLVDVYITIPAGKDSNFFAEKARAAGAVIAWSFTGYDKAQTSQIKPGEIFIDQHWQKGDAAVTVKGYDVNILPTSGIIANAVLWMVEADMAPAAAK